MKKNKTITINSEEILNVISIFFGVFSIVAGVILMILKLFGFPFLFEGFVAFVLGDLIILSSALNITFKKLLKTFQDLVDQTEKEKKHIVSPSSQDYSVPEGYSAKIYNLDSDEDAEKLAKQLNDNLFSPISSISNQKKEYNQMNLKELKAELKKSIEKEEFEKAALIQKHIKDYSENNNKN